MKNILLVICLIILAACNKLPAALGKKTYNVVELSPKVQVESPSKNINIPQASSVSSWGVNSSFPNPYINNIKVDKDFCVGKFSKLSGATIIADPVIAEGQIFILNSKGNLSSYNSEDISKIW